ncbi:MAG: hypothetical protein ICV67_03020 [Thermoleophilia bacterium]|nr:hypothetical protein [Thermoleophilia bacterium]
MHRLRVLLVAASVSLAIASPAAADVVLAQDGHGRTITFDVQTADVNTSWYASILSAAYHGDEISRVTIRIMAPAEIAGVCGSGAAACYSQRRTGALIVVPAGQSDALAAIVLHEYGHHIDASTAVPGIREPNGTPRWWAARGMPSLVESGEVARDYGLGWERAIGEIFAEDYVQAHMTARFRIRWLAPPAEDILGAIRQDLGVEPARPVPPEAAEPVRAPLVVTRSGALAVGRRQALPFTLLGPGRRVTFTVTLLRGRVRMEIVCDGRVVARQTLGPGRRRATLHRSALGPASCRAAVRNAGTATARYSLRLRLAVETS